MKRKIFLILIILLLSIIVSVVMQFFVWSRISVLPFFAKYHLDKNNEKTIIINKTEKITVKENFSLEKPAEKVLPATVEIYFLPKNNLKQEGITVAAESSSGVILSGDGVVVTVLPEFEIRDKIIKVLLADGTEYEAAVKREDNFSGLLVLKIEADNLPVAPFGNANNLHNGEKVIVTGKTMSDNKPIFALRTIQENSWSFSKKGLGFLFSDENSHVFILDNLVDKQFVGGPVVDFNGTVVGLVGMIDNIKGKTAFVIPFENVKDAMEYAFSEKNKDNEKFGVYYLNINKKLKMLNNLMVDRGALVYSPSAKNGLAVLAGSIGQKIGLRVGDIIIYINNVEIGNTENLSELLRTQNLNKDLVVRVIRNNKEFELKMNKD